MVVKWSLKRVEFTYRKCLKLSSLDKVKLKKKNHRVLLIFLLINCLSRKSLQKEWASHVCVLIFFFFGVSFSLVPDNFLISKYCGLEVAQVLCWYFYNRKPPMLRN